MKKLSLLLVLFFLPLAASARDLTPDEAAAWQLEEAYWQHVKANDLDGYRTLWDERFVGWQIITGMSASYDH